MKITKIMFICLLFFVIFFCGKAFAQKDVSCAQGSVKTTGASEPAKAAEPVEAAEPAKPAEEIIPYSAPYNSSNTGADQVEVDEDA